MLWDEPGLVNNLALALSSLLLGAMAGFAAGGGDPGGGHTA